MGALARKQVGGEAVDVQVALQSRKKIAEWCRRNRHHRPMREQWEQLREKVRGHYGYYGIIGNSRALARFLYEVERCWHKWLNRRSQRGNLSWARMRLLLKRYPLQCRAFVSPRAAKPCHEEPDASITHVRICGGARALQRSAPTRPPNERRRVLGRGRGIKGWLQE